MRFGLTALALVCSALSWSATVLAAPVCGSHSSKVLGRPVTYCVERSRPELPESRAEPVVYFMHGINGSAKSWVDNGYSEAVNTLARDPGSFPAMTFVSFDTAGLSLFSDHAGQPQGADAYETWLVQEFIPWYESQHTVCARRECRGIAGISMGGFGALKTALRHSGLFSVAAANSPALWPFPLYSSLSDWLAYCSRHEVGPVRGMSLVTRARGVFTSPELADQNDPASLARSFWDVSRRPALFFDVGGRDYFGFHEGFGRFKSALDESGWEYRSNFVPDGTHDLFWQTRWDLLRFLAEKLAKKTEPASVTNRDRRDLVQQ